MPAGDLRLTFLLLLSLCMTAFPLCLYDYVSSVRRHIASSRIIQLVARCLRSQRKQERTLPLPRAKLLVVHRSILQTLALLKAEPELGHEVHYEEADLARSKKSRAAWPPLVTHIPEPNPSPPKLIHRRPASVAIPLQIPRRPLDLDLHARNSCRSK
ncbi:hypothetical protein FIBSPDRAFT_467128 [Athelia psychrophila]|uniref:Secreted protein n=1 Tax=Athelia psychrophila TaxID=1759441 RepID=A0A167U4M3_9AGAM|nr:hypothetical protein FIBSPDRAFT_467128 [Fibularhizoctonia sp. CBS 109695]